MKLTSAVLGTSLAASSAFSSVGTSRNPQSVQAFAYQKMNPARVPFRSTTALMAQPLNSRQFGQTNLFAARGLRPLMACANEAQATPSPENLILQERATTLGLGGEAQLEMPAADLYAAAGVYDAQVGVPEHLKVFIEQSDDALAEVREQVATGKMSVKEANHFQALLTLVGERVLNHPIIADNQYLARFSDGVTKEQAKHELQQFSVFAFQFNVALAKLIANTDDKDEWRHYTKILANEMGAPYAHGFDGDLKGVYALEHNHHEWLEDDGKTLGLEFADIGSTKVAHEGTMSFVNAVDQYYTSPDRNVRGGAAFAIENWAANNLWIPWIDGVKKLNQELPKGEKVSMAYLTYHKTEESFHSKEMIDELLESFQTDGFDAEKFLASAETMLDEGPQAYYTEQAKTVPGGVNDGWPS